MAAIIEQKMMRIEEVYIGFVVVKEMMVIL